MNNIYRDITKEMAILPKNMLEIQHLNKVRHDIEQQATRVAIEALEELKKIKEVNVEYFHSHATKDNYYGDVYPSKLKEKESIQRMIRILRYNNLDLNSELRNENEVINVLRASPSDVSESVMSNDN